MNSRQRGSPSPRRSVVRLSVVGVVICRIPDDCIDPKRYPLFMAREVVLELLAQFKAESKVDAKVGT